MPTPPDEAELTAYALGELDDRRRAEIEAAMAGDAPGQQAVAETREAAERLRRALAAEPMPHLTPAQRRSIEARAAAVASGPAAAPAAGRARRLVLRAALPAAAAVLLALGAGWAMHAAGWLPPHEEPSVTRLAASGETTVLALRRTVQHLQERSGRAANAPGGAASIRLIQQPEAEWLALADGQQDRAVTCFYLEGDGSQRGGAPRDPSPADGADFVWAQWGQGPKAASLIGRVAPPESAWYWAYGLGKDGTGNAIAGLGELRAKNGYARATSGLTLLPGLRFPGAAAGAEGEAETTILLTRDLAAKPAGAAAVLAEVGGQDPYDWHAAKKLGSFAYCEARAYDAEHFLAKSYEAASAARGGTRNTIVGGETYNTLGGSAIVDRYAVSPLTTKDVCVVTGGLWGAGADGSATVQMKPEPGRTAAPELIQLTEAKQVSLVVNGGSASTFERVWDAGNAAGGRQGLMDLRRGEWRTPGTETADSFREPSEKWNREAYGRIVENPFRKVADHPLSTFAIDVDTASYANVRRMLNAGRVPPRGAVRIEEMINYFPYDYAGPAAGDEHPFAVHAAVARCPWKAGHRLVRVALKGREIRPDSRPSSNLVFLLDVSGSMSAPNKLPLVRKAMKMLVERLGENDGVAIAVYAEASGLVLDSTPCDRKEPILRALANLTSGGSTNGGAGIRLAYNVAADHFVRGGVNRVILCTDGDFNVGTTSEAELVRLVEQKAKTGVFLSVLGFGTRNLQDSRMEKLADKGNGNYAYVDTLAEAQKVLVDQMSGTLVTIAKDVKVQVEFNPARVEAYRLIGYENRLLAKEDFNDDTKDAGEVGAGHTVTALYELIPAGGKAPVAKVDPLRYQRPAGLTAAALGDEMLTIKLRYKKPEGDKSILLTCPVRDRDGRFETAPADFRFAAAVAAFGMVLRDSKHKGTYTLDAAIEQARSALGKDPFGYRAEFVDLARKAKQLIKGR